MVQLKLRISNTDTIVQFCFNSCMVQLKYYFDTIKEHDYEVLIPVWCN